MRLLAVSKYRLVETRTQKANPVATEAGSGTLPQYLATARVTCVLLILFYADVV